MWYCLLNIFLLTNTLGGEVKNVTHAEVVTVYEERTRIVHLLRSMYVAVLGRNRTLLCCVPQSRKKGPMGGVHYFVLRQGGGQIFVTLLHFTMKQRLCLHYHNLQQDIAHQHTRPVLLAAVKFWIAGGDVSFEFTAPYAYYVAMPNRRSARNRVQQTAKAHHRNSSGSGSRRNTVGHVPREI